jgi:hypothetical protein
MTLDRPNTGSKALRDNLGLLFNRPTPSPLTVGNDLDRPRRSSHMTTLMTAPYRAILLDRRVLALHDKPSAHKPRSCHGGGSNPLTQQIHERVLFSLFAAARHRPGHAT